MSKQLRADLMLVLVTAFWGTSYWLTDVCLVDMPPMFLNAFRFLSAFIVLAIFFYKRMLHLNRSTLRYSLLIGLALTGTYIFYGYGISRTSLSNAGFICGMPVLFTPFLDFIVNHKRPGRRMLLCLLMCVVGLALLTLNEDMRPATGDIICMGVPICYSIDLLMMEKAVQKPEVDALSLGVCQLGVVGLITLAMSLLIEQPHFPTNTFAWGAALFLGLFCSGVAFVVQSVEQQYTSATHVGLIFTLEPLFSAILAYFVASEVLLTRGYIGMALMFLSLVFMELNTTKYTAETDI